MGLDSRRTKLPDLTAFHLRLERAAGALSPVRWSLLIALLTAVVTAVLLLARPFLSVPWENDFVSLALRSRSPAEVWRINGYWPLGYPLALWALNGLTGNPFLSGKVIAVLAAGLFSWAGYFWLAGLLPPRLALLAQVALAVNVYFAESALFLGTDLPWAALQVLALATLAGAVRRDRLALVALAGAANGLAYLFRYTALISLPVAVAYLLLLRPLPGGWRRNGLAAALFVGAFLLLASPQLWLGWQQTGDPFFNAQAKNVWFGVYGQADWRRYWGQAATDITLWQVFAVGPVRFLAHWAREFATLLAYLPFLALGASPSALKHASLAGQALYGLSGLGALGAVVGAAWGSLGAQLGRLRGLGWRGGWLVILYGPLYGLAVSLVFFLPRALLSLLPVLAGLTVAWLAARPQGQSWRLATLALLLIVSTVFSYGQRLERGDFQAQQVAGALRTAGASGEAAVVAASVTTPFALEAPGRVDELPADLATWVDLHAFLAERGASYLIYDDRYGLQYWPQFRVLLDPQTDVPGFRRLGLWGDGPRVVLLGIGD